MQIDPKVYPEERCGKCGLYAGLAVPGDRWYRMNFNTFCSTCSKAYAYEEGFELSETIGEIS
jgi:hypothetical protein